jgi:hypothetical protein
MHPRAIACARSPVEIPHRAPPAPCADRGCYPRNRTISRVPRSGNRIAPHGRRPFLSPRWLCRKRANVWRAQDLLAGASNGRLTPVVSAGDVSASMLRVVGEELGFQEGARDESEIVEESHLPEVRCVDDGRVLSHSACGQQLCIMLKSQADRLLARDSVRFLGGSPDAFPNSYVAIGRVCKRCCRF